MQHDVSYEATGTRRPHLLTKLVLALAGIAFALTLFGASSAKAEPVGYVLGEGVINLGGEEEGLWAKLVDPGLTPPDPPSTLNAEVAGDGTLTAAAGDFYFPPKRIEDLETGNALLPFIDANVAIAAEGPITGNFDTASGETDVSIPADVLMTIFSAGSPSSVARCRIDGFNLEFTTATDTMADPGDPEADPPRPAADYEAAEFAPPSGDGSMIARWPTLPTSDIEGGSLAGIVCPAMDDLLGGPGGVWLSGQAGNNIEPPEPPKPLVAPKLTTTPANSTTQTTADFAFAQGDGETSAVTGFECKLDAGAFEPCNDGKKNYSGLAASGHSFEVRAVNDSGAGPGATFSWTVTGGAIPPPPPARAGLGKVTIKPKSKKVKRGKKATFTVSINNTGDAAASGVKICASAPKKLVSVKKCRTVGSLAAGASKTVKFKVTVKKKAKKGKKVTITFKATSGNAGAKSAKATVKTK